MIVIDLTKQRKQSGAVTGNMFERLLYMFAKVDPQWTGIMCNVIADTMGQAHAEQISTIVEQMVSLSCCAHIANIKAFPAHCLARSFSHTCLWRVFFAAFVLCIMSCVCTCTT